MRRLLWPLALLRRHQHLLWALAVFGTVLGLAVVSGYSLFYRAAYFLGGLIVLSFLWARANLRRLTVSIERPDSRLQVGQQAVARVRIANGGFYPKLWLEVEDPSDLPGPPARTVLTLAAHSHRVWKASVPCRQRGLFTLGPITVTSGDPFGLFRFRRRFGQTHSLLVYPLPEELPYFAAPSAHLSGDAALRRPTHHITPNAASLREYHPGDSYNRIHWPSTARLGRLMVKTFDMDPSSEIWVLLDLERSVQAGSGQESTEEYGVRIACSIAHRLLQEERPVGFLAYAGQITLLEPGRGPVHYGRILEALALVRAEGRTPLAEVVAREARRFGRHSTLVLVTPSAREDWVAALQDLAQQGTRAAVVLMEPSSFGARESALLAYSTLVASDILTYLVRRGDDLSLALGPDGAAQTARPAPWRRR